jgi:hypothetical protein
MNRFSRLQEARIVTYVFVSHAPARPQDPSPDHFQLIPRTSIQNVPALSFYKDPRIHGSTVHVPRYPKVVIVH